MNRMVVVITSLLLTLVGAGSAQADDWRVRLLPERGAVPEHVISQIGTSLQIGGGVSDFVQEEVGGMSDPAGAWNARAILGTRSFISGELGYIGSAQTIDALGLDTSAALVRNGLEANLRLNLPIVNCPWMLAPYALGGVGWSRYHVIHEGNNTSSVRNADDVFAVPFGGGFAANYKQLSLDLRYMYYPTFDDELLMTPTGSTDTAAGLDSWLLGMTVGYEF